MALTAPFFYLLLAPTLFMLESGPIKRNILSVGHRDSGRPAQHYTE